MNEEIKTALDRMHDCAAEAGGAVQHFGKGSVQHMTLTAIFSDAARYYEDMCRKAGREPYATYDGD